MLEVFEAQIVESRLDQPIFIESEVAACLFAQHANDVDGLLGHRQINGRVPNHRRGAILGFTHVEQRRCGKRHHERDKVDLGLLASRRHGDLLQLLVVIQIVVVVVIFVVDEIGIQIIQIHVHIATGCRCCSDPHLRTTGWWTFDRLLKRNRRSRLIGHVWQRLQVCLNLLLSQLASTQTALLNTNIPENGIVTHVSHDAPHIEANTRRCQLKLPICGATFRFGATSTMMRAAKESFVQSSARPLACRDYMPLAGAGEEAAKQGLSPLALQLVGSEILKIAASVRALQAQGHAVCNLTVGDFLPKQFPIPPKLQAAVIRAYEQRETNYPPSDGMPTMREAVVELYRRTLGLDYPVESVAIFGGARPAIYGTYRAIVAPGERVIYSTPSWNNNHYVRLADAVAVECETSPDEGFMPTAESLRPLLPGARLLCLNSPLNPTGTVIDKDELRRISELVLDENLRRKRSGERTLYVMYDQVYYALTFGQTQHHTPPELCPEMAAYTVFVDAISKSLCATGLRVGWAVAPPYVMGRMRDILGHVGAWAPRPEQVATAEIFRDPEGLAAFQTQMNAEVEKRLSLLYRGISELGADGLPVRAIPPQGAIYLSVQFNLHGRKLPDGTVISTNEQVRNYLLHAAGMAVVPFQAFGMRQETGWMRLSVGAVSIDDITMLLPRLREALLAVA